MEDNLSMHRQWRAVEDECSRLIKIIYHGNDKDLLNALDTMDTEQIKSAVTHISQDGQTLLHLAVLRERLESVKAMLRNQVDVNARDGDGNSPLYNCLSHHCLSSAVLLINHGADVNELVSRQTKESLLHRMIKGGRQQQVELLLKEGAACDARTKDGDTPLHFAARFCRPAMARRLVHSGANVNIVNEKEETPLHVAIAYRSMDVAKILVKNGASMTAKDKQGMTALHVAVAASSIDLVRLMLNSNSTQVNSKESLLGRTPLLLACSNSNQKMATLLLTHGADANLTTNFRRSVLHVAASSGNTKMLGAVIKHATNLNALATNNKTPLHLAVIEGHEDMVRALLRAGANVNMKDIEGNTPLHMASSLGNMDIISLLLHHGAHIKATNMRQMTALHVASKEGHEDTYWMLVHSGCDPDMLDIQEKTAMHYLEEFQQEVKERAAKSSASKGRVRFSDVNDEFIQDTNIQWDEPNEGSSAGNQDPLSGDATERVAAADCVDFTDSKNTTTITETSASPLTQVDMKSLPMNKGADGEIKNKTVTALSFSESQDLETSSDEGDEDDTHRESVISDISEGEAHQGARRRRVSKGKHRKSSKGKSAKQSKTKAKHKTSKADEANGHHSHDGGESHHKEDHSHGSDIKCQRKRKVGVIALK